MENPALRAYPRSQHAPVIPLQKDASILAWLENTGRLLDRDSDDTFFGDEEEEINELMAGEDDGFDDDDDLLLDDE
jgi:hypothetical protein